jgi:hypothetical protein
VGLTSTSSTDEFRRRYPALGRSTNLGLLVEDEPNSALGQLIRHGHVRLVPFGKVSFDEEEVAAAHAAELLRHDGEQSMADFIRDSIGHGLAPFIGQKLSRLAVKSMADEVRQAVLGVDGVEDCNVVVTNNEVHVRANIGGAQYADIRLELKT